MLRFPHRLPAIDMSKIRAYKVLVVDASSSNRELICECLRQLHDVEVLAAAEGRQAIELFACSHPALILSDTALPDMDGVTFARKIRSREKLGMHNPLTYWTPIVFLSASTDEEMLAKGIIAGADDFLYKPVSEVILLAKVRAMLRIVGMQRDIYAAHRKLREISSLDGLTCIPNRRHFDDMLATEWKRCQRSNSPLSIALVDVDYFKQFNDTYGHQAGDACLKTVASALQEGLFRVEDSVARYGGEEFAAVLPGTDQDGAHAVAERMRLAIRELCIPHEKGIAGLVSCSFGVASVIPSGESSAAGLLALADAALYQAKQRGRNRVQINDRQLVTAE